MVPIKDIIKEAYGYYSVECSDDGYDGEVIVLTPEQFRIYFQHEVSGDEDRFRARLDKMDEWFQTKPYAVQKKWAALVLKWLSEEKKEKEG